MNLQASVDRHFEHAADYWRDVYSHADLAGQIYQERLAEICRIIDALRLPGGRRVLDAGCGAGKLAVELGRRGYRVDAIDTVWRMVLIAHTAALESGVEGSVQLRLASISQLPFQDGAFEAAIAAGVTPWLPDLVKPLDELARVVRPGGYLVITADNRLALTRLLDPIGRLKQTAGAALRGLGLRRTAARVRMYSPWRFDGLLRAAGFEILQRESLGFGPFRAGRRMLLSDRMGVRVHRTLQTLADRQLPLIRSLGRQYIVVARKGGALHEHIF